MPKKVIRTLVYEVRSNFTKSERYLDRAVATHRARELSKLHGWRFRVTPYGASPRELHQWGLGPDPNSAREPRPRSTRRRKPHPARCPSCGAAWYGPGRPRKDGSRNVAPPLDPLEYDGPDPSTLQPSPNPDLADRPGLAGLLDPRLHEELPDDW